MGSRGTCLCLSAWAYVAPRQARAGTFKSIPSFEKLKNEKLIVLLPDDRDFEPNQWEGRNGSAKITQIRPNVNTGMGVYKEKVLSIPGPTKPDL